ncbi:Hypothetical predicted protein [Podarcis lilfordi]|uniref:Uncharacterized protein n=1 Tax=Podarcis lilfordi TaxID=74358 RepID=A0AA35KEV8_9SAUR|nr:Hypothetical predicted protein [Podarcis lilfordi]
MSLYLLSFPVFLSPETFETLSGIFKDSSSSSLPVPVSSSLRQWRTVPVTQHTSTLLFPFSHTGALAKNTGVAALVVSDSGFPQQTADQSAKGTPRWV